MPFDLIGFSEGTPGTGTVGITPGAEDTLFRTSGDDLILKSNQKLYSLLGIIYAAESTGGRALVRQPGLGYAGLDYEFLKCALTSDVDPIQGYEDHFGAPLPLIGDQKLNVLSVNATDEDTLIGILVGTAPISQAMLDQVRPTHKLTGYADTTLTANQWTPCTVTWQQDLPVGQYAIVGMRAGVFLAANAWTTLMRLLIPGGTDWRPGVPAVIMEADHEEYQSITAEPWARWPVMKDIVIDENHMPNIECLSPSAITDENIQLLLQKLS